MSLSHLTYGNLFIWHTITQVLSYVSFSHLIPFRDKITEKPKHSLTVSRYGYQPVERRQ
jgi:hypothetical protein